MNPEWRGKGYSWKGSLGPQGPGDPHCQSQTPHGRRKWTMRFWVPDAAGQGWSRHVRQVYRQTEGNKGAAAAGGREHGGRGGAPACRWPPRRRTGLSRGSEGWGDGSDQPDPCNARDSTCSHQREHFPAQHGPARADGVRVGVRVGLTPGRKRRKTAPRPSRRVIRLRIARSHCGDGLLRARSGPHSFFWLLEERARWLV